MVLPSSSLRTTPRRASSSSMAFLSQVKFWHVLLALFIIKEVVEWSFPLQLSQFSPRTDTVATADAVDCRQCADKCASKAKDDSAEPKAKDTENTENKLVETPQTANKTPVTTTTTTTTIRHKVDKQCNNHGSFLLETCFCLPGFEGSVCNTSWTTTQIPPCGAYDDRCFFHPDYGVAQVSEERWKSAQSFQDAAEQRTSDRNLTANFAGYASLNLAIDNNNFARHGDTTVLGNMLEVGAGPFTQSLTILEQTGLRPVTITLLEPLAETYMKTVKACRYKTGKLDNGQGLVIDNTAILPVPAEKFNLDGKYTEHFDTIVLLNMIEHVQDAFLIYQKALQALKPGGMVIFHERYWPGYKGMEVTNKREFDLHPIRLNERFAHWMSTEFELTYEKSQMEVWGNLGYYWVGRKPVVSLQTRMQVLSVNMAQHAKMLLEHGFDEHKIWGNIYNGQDLEQPREYMSYARLPWVKTICEIGFAGGHSTIVYSTANPQAKVYRFDDLGKKELSEKAYQVLQETVNITLTVGDSTQEVPKFVETHPDVYCDVISVDGAHHEHFPNVDLHNFKYLANYPNVVLIDDYHEKDWPAVTLGVKNRVNEGSMKLRHVTASSIIFREKQKQWAIGEYTLLTVIICTMDPRRTASVEEMVNEAANHPAVQQVIILWNTPSTEMPEAIAKLARLPSTPGNNKARVTVLKKDSSSLNNRYDPNLPVHTEAVMLLDDDLTIKTDETITCALKAFQSDPSRIYSFGDYRTVTRDAANNYGSQPPNNMLLPRMIFHKSFLSIYSGPQFDKLRTYVDTQKGHCDDIAFVAVLTQHTGKPLVKIDAFVQDKPELAIQGLTSSKTRVRDREECSRDILNMLDWDIPLIEQKSCASFK